MPKACLTLDLSIPIFYGILALHTTFFDENFNNFSKILAQNQADHPRRKSKSISNSRPSIVPSLLYPSNFFGNFCDFFLIFSEFSLQKMRFHILLYIKHRSCHIFQKIGQINYSRRRELGGNSNMGFQSLAVHGHIQG